MPLGDLGYTHTLHNAECPVPCNGDPSRCMGHIVQFSQHEPPGDGRRQAAEMLQSWLRDSIDPTIDLSIELPPGQASFASASIAGPPKDDCGVGSDSFSAAFSWLKRSADAIRIAARSIIPPLTIERIWPLYVTFDYAVATGVTTPRAMYVPESLSDGTAPMTPPQAEEADRIVAQPAEINAITRINDMRLRAMSAARTHGDYTAAVLFAATACELLIKHPAAMLVWEEVTYRTTPALWSNTTFPPVATYPHTLLDSVLEPALGGSWARDGAGDPLWSWQHDVQRLRNRAMHEGYTPTSLEARAAVSAIDDVMGHVAERLARQAQHFPRTSLSFLGPDQLELRGALPKVRATYLAAEAGGETWDVDYNDWVAESQRAHEEKRWRPGATKADLLRSTGADAAS